MFLVKIENKLREILDKIPNDKRLHYIIGNVLSIFLILILKIFGFTKNETFFLDLFIMFLVSIGIEIFQKITNSGTYDLEDFKFTYLGSILPLLII